MIKQILLGVGNVGVRYDGTRHNIGFDVIEAVAQNSKKLKPVSFNHSVASEAEINGETVLLIKPTTLVNLSGLAAREALDKYELLPENMLVVVDDFHLPVGAIRYRKKGSAGGHNGLKSLIEECGNEFHRLRCGVGPLPENESIIDFVLGQFDKDEIEEKREAVETAAQTIPTYLKDGIEEAMNRFNSQKKIDKKDSSKENPSIEEK